MTKHHERILKDVFPDAAALVFSTKTRGFVPLPIEFRLLLKHLSAAECRVLMYLYVRANKDWLAFPTIPEMAADLGVTPKHLPTHLKELERKGFLNRATKSGRTYFLMLDPGRAIRQLVDLGLMTEDELREINGLREDIGHELIERDQPRD